MASYHFRNFFETYPRSELVEEAMFMRAKSLYKISPKSSLDQASSEKAITAFQNYINKYPSSIHAIEVNQKVDELQEKLEFKTYNNTKLYHKIGYYKAAVIAIENFRVGFPDSHYNEELQYLKIESQYLLAKNSLGLVQDEDGNLIHLKKDRLNEAKKFYFNFIDSYPNSKFMLDAQGILEEIDTKLNNLG